MRYSTQCPVLKATVVTLAMLAAAPALGQSEPPTMQSGGAQTPPGGGRPDSRLPQLGTGNRGTGQEATQGVSGVDPGQVRREAKEPGRITGHVLKMEGDAYVVRDTEGNEILVRPGPDTRIESVITIGQMMEADVDQAGRVRWMRRAP